MPVFQKAVGIRDAQNEAIETWLGAGAVLKIFGGAMPANVAAADTGVALATLALPSDYMAASSGGAKAKLGTWQDAAADQTGTATHWRMYRADGTTCGLQGDCTITSGDGTLKLDSTSFTVGQSFAVTAFTITQAGA